MPRHLGAHAPRLAAARKLLGSKGRREQDRFLFEGPTLLAQAHKSALEIEEAFATEAAYERTPLLQTMEADGIAVWLLDEPAAGRLSDVESPTGIVAIARRRFAPLSELFEGEAPVLVLADLSDPGNAGTLLRCAEAFGAAGVVFGRLGVDPYHPKVVRAAMGSLFALPVALAQPDELSEPARAAGRTIVGLSARGEPLSAHGLGVRPVLLVGQERHGLGPWDVLCSRRVAIPTSRPVESLNASVAGAIALYEAAGR